MCMQNRSAQAQPMYKKNLAHGNNSKVAQFRKKKEHRPGNLTFPPCPMALSFKGSWFKFSSHKMGHPLKNTIIRGGFYVSKHVLEWKQSIKIRHKDVMLFGPPCLPDTICMQPTSAKAQLTKKFPRGSTSKVVQFFRKNIDLATLPFPLAPWNWVSSDYQVFQTLGWHHAHSVETWGWGGGSEWVKF